MKKRLTSIAILIGLIVGGYILATVALNNFLSGPRLKAMLIEPAEKVLAKDVEVGSIKVSIFKGISINDIAIKDSRPEKFCRSGE